MVINKVVNNELLKQIGWNFDFDHKDENLITRVSDMASVKIDTDTKFCNLKKLEINKYDQSQGYCGIIDKVENVIFFETFEDVDTKFFGLLKSVIVTIDICNIPYTAHGRILYILEEWQRYLKMDVLEKLRYKGFSYQPWRGGWCDACCTLNPPFWAAHDFARGDFTKIKSYRTAIKACGQLDVDANEEELNKMEASSWKELKPYLESKMRLLQADEKGYKVEGSIPEFDKSEDVETPLLSGKNTGGESRKSELTFESEQRDMFHRANNRGFDSLQEKNESK